MRRNALIVCYLLLFAVCSLPANAEAWNAQFGFTPDVMSPPWSYVYQIGTTWDGTFNFTNMVPYEFEYGEEIIKMYVAPGTALNPADSVPLVAALPSWSRLRVSSCTENDTENNRPAAQGFLVFTAPISGSYKFTGKVMTYGGEGIPIDTTAWIRTQASGQLWSGNVLWTGSGSIGQSPNTDPAFDLTMNLSAGEKVVFGQTITTGSSEAFGYSPLWWIVHVMLNEPNVAKYTGTTWPKFTHSTRQTTTRTSYKACDDDLASYWLSQLEAWGNYPYPHPWIVVEFDSPKTFNKVELYVQPDLQYIPKEFAIDIWDDSLNNWKQIAYGKKANNAPHYIFLYPQGYTTSKVRYRCEIMDGFSSGYYTQTAVAELKFINSSNTSSWATVSGVIKDSNNKPVKNAYPYFHYLAGVDTLGNWSNTQYFGTRSDENGQYSVVIDTAMVSPLLGGNEVCVYALGQSATAPDPDPEKYGVTKVSVNPIAGQTVNLDITLPGPKEAWTTLGQGSQGEWLELKSGVEESLWYVENTEIGTPPTPCAKISTSEMVFQLSKQFGDGRFDKMYVDVEYFDTGYAGMELILQNVPEDNKNDYYKAAPSKIRKENSGIWRNQTLTFENGIVMENYWRFDSSDPNAENFGSFSLKNWLSAPYDNYVKKVSVRFAPKQMPETVDLTIGSVGSPGQHPAVRCESNGLYLRLAPTLMPGNDNPSNIVENVGGTGKSGFLINRNANRSSFYVDIDNHYSFEILPAIWLTVEYFNSPAGYIQVLMPDVNSELVVGALLYKDGSNTWATKTIKLENVSTKDGLNLVYGGGASTGDIQFYDIDYTTSIIRKISVSKSDPEQGFTPYSTISGAKSAGINTGVELPAKPVTANFGSFFYIEEADRSSGIRVNGTTTATPGQEVAVKGTLVEVNGEKAIQAAQISSPAPASVLVPVGVVQKSLHNLGLSTVGLLVQVWGNVVSGVGSNVFEIDDGSGAIVTIAAPSGYSAPSGFVVVNGVCGLSSPNTPIIRVNSITDITQVP